MIVLFSKINVGTRNPFWLSMLFCIEENKRSFIYASFNRDRFSMRYYSKAPSFGSWNIFPSDVEIRGIACSEPHHSSEIRALCFMKCSRKPRQNVLYFWNTKAHNFFHLLYLIFFNSLMNALVCIRGRNKAVQNK